MMGGVLRFLSWLGMGLAGVGLILLAWERVFPLAPETFSVRRSEAVEIARNAVQELGGEASAPLARAQIHFNRSLERRLLRDLSHRRLQEVRREPLGAQVLAWQVRFTAAAGGFHEVRVGLDGTVHAARVQFEATGSRTGERRAVRRAAAFLTRRGVDLGAFSTPWIQAGDRTGRVEVRFPRHDTAARLDGLSHGIGVVFDGGRLSGWGHWMLDADGPADRSQLLGQNYLRDARILVIGLFFLVLVALWFRYYDAGRMRLRRSLHVAELVAAAGIPWLVLSLREVGAGDGARRGLWILGAVLFVVFMGFLAFLTSGIGEALARDRWQHRLAAFEAVFQGDWRNTTVARAVLHGLAVGALGGGLALSLALPLQWYGGTALAGPLYRQAMFGGVPAAGLLLHEIFLLGVPMLLVFLVAVPFLFERLGPRTGFLASWALTALMVPAPFQVSPVWVGLPWILVLSSIPLVLFLGSDLLAALVAVWVMRLSVGLFPLLLAADGALRFGGWVVLGGVLLPAAWCLRGLQSKRSFSYGYDPSSEIPMDVLERVADRERRLLELETAKEVQTAILPRVPSGLQGLRMAHSYLPASEIGGDFYDVYPLDEHRLAFALGDVAGHGISSGLVMSTVRGALRAHFRFEPGVREVFSSINGMLCEMADRRLITTLVYGMIDLRTGEAQWGASGQVVWCVGADGTVSTWAPTTYPLGVRPRLEIEVVHRRLAPDDTLVLVSDGLIEARRADDEPYGFERLETCLAAVAGLPAADILSGLLLGVSEHLGTGRRGSIETDDDCTTLVLQVVGRAVNTD